MQEPPVSGPINVRAPRYFGARALCACWRCRRETLVLGIALGAEHETWIDAAEGSLGAGRASGVWQAARAGAWLFFVEHIAVPVRRRLQLLSPWYRYAHNRATDGSYWINHCSQCGSAQDDDYLHGEPDVAFMPITAAAAARIELCAIDEPLAAWVGGYCENPPLFEAMRVAPPLRC